MAPKLVSALKSPKRVKRARDDTDDERLDADADEGHARPAQRRRTEKQSSPARPRPTPSESLDAKKQELRHMLNSLAKQYKLSLTQVKNLYSATSCRAEHDELVDLCKWYSPRIGKARMSTDERARVESYIKRRVWTHDDDVIAMAGTEKARGNIDKVKGRNACRKRKQALETLGVESVNQLQRSWPFDEQ